MSLKLHDDETPLSLDGQQLAGNVSMLNGSIVNGSFVRAAAILGMCEESATIRRRHHIHAAVCDGELVWETMFNMRMKMHNAEHAHMNCLAYFTMWPGIDVRYQKAHTKPGSIQQVLDYAKLTKVVELHGAQKASATRGGEWKRGAAAMKVAGVREALEAAIGQCGNLGNPLANTGDVSQVWQVFTGKAAPLAAGFLRWLVAKFPRLHQLKHHPLKTWAAFYKDSEKHREEIADAWCKATETPREVFSEHVKSMEVLDPLPCSVETAVLIYRQWENPDKLKMLAEAKKTSNAVATLVLKVFAEEMDEWKNARKFGDDELDAAPMLPAVGGNKRGRGGRGAALQQEPSGDSSDENKKQAWALWRGRGKIIVLGDNYKKDDIKGEISKAVILPECFGLLDLNLTTMQMHTPKAPGAVKLTADQEGFVNASYDVGSSCKGMVTLLGNSGKVKLLGTHNRSRDGFWQLPLEYTANCGDSKPYAQYNTLRAPRRQTLGLRIDVDALKDEQTQMRAEQPQDEDDANTTTEKNPPPDLIDDLEDYLTAGGAGDGSVAIMLPIVPGRPPSEVSEAYGSDGKYQGIFVGMPNFDFYSNWVIGLMIKIHTSTLVDFRTSPAGAAAIVTYNDRSLKYIGTAPNECAKKWLEEMIVDHIVTLRTSKSARWGGGKAHMREAWAARVDPFNGVRGPLTEYVRGKKKEKPKAATDSEAFGDGDQDDTAPKKKKTKRKLARHSTLSDCEEDD
ncbi:unnamed protein product [Amoebophrya sp. A25]|nr:unnamed protein product [Amoebophrya sp. A25]|eukprot:GSA25T00018081001.1